MEAELGVGMAEGGELGLRLLDAVLAEPGLTGVQRLEHGVGTVGLGDGDQVGGAGGAAGGEEGRVDTLLDRVDGVCDGRAGGLGEGMHG